MISMATSIKNGISGSASARFPAIGGGTIGEWLAAALIMCVALIPFFAFREMTRAIGRPQFYALCFTGRLKAAR